MNNKNTTIKVYF